MRNVTAKRAYDPEDQHLLVMTDPQYPKRLQKNLLSQENSARGSDIESRHRRTEEFFKFLDVKNGQAERERTNFKCTPLTRSPHTYRNVPRTKVNFFRISMPFCSQRTKLQHKGTVVSIHLTSALTFRLRNHLTYFDENLSLTV